MMLKEMDMEVPVRQEAFETQMWEDMEADKFSAYGEGLERNDEGLMIHSGGFNEKGQ